MSRIDTIFSNTTNALITFVVAGDPSIEATEEAIIAMEAAGADIIEIGIPFSDPIADGPVIAAAMHRSLQRGTTPAEVLGMVSNIRSQLKAGIIAMVSHSIVDKSGGLVFIDRLAEAGFDGIIIPDIDETAAKPLSEHCRTIDFSFTMLIAPTTPLVRIKKLAALSTGFLYVLARTGLTGEQAEMPDLTKRMNEIRSVTDLPLAVGFGISNASQVAAVHEFADAAIVGSALVRRLEESDDPTSAASKFVLEISH